MSEITMARYGDGSATSSTNKNTNLTAENMRTRSNLSKYRGFTFGIKRYALIVILAGCSSQDVRSVPPDPAAAIARNIRIIKNSSIKHPRSLKIMFYGQSISSTKWTDQAMFQLRSKYSGVSFIYRNYSIGGFSSEQLLRTAARDVEEFYPDLIVFHVYGDHRAYEKIIRIFRSLTAADVIVQTDHVTVPVEPICDEGIRLTYTPPPGCKGHFRFKQKSWEEFMSAIWVPKMAKVYNLAIEPRRDRWNAYLKFHHLAPEALLADSPHPNRRGWKLMANLFTSWFEGLVARPTMAKPLESGLVSSMIPPTAGSRKIYRFVGNRIELLASGPLDGHIRARIDGKAPEGLDGCWQNSRVSRLSNVPDWPALRHVTVDPGYHHQDHWTLRIQHLDERQEKFDFELFSSVSGPGGSGNGDSSFKSRSGQVSIAPDDWVLAYARKKTGRGVPEGFSADWYRTFVCRTQPATRLANGGVEQRYLVATGLENGPHVVEITVNGEAPAISEVRTYRPPLLIEHSSITG